MSYCCSQCSFTSQFKSALSMHHQLHHESANEWDSKKLQITNQKSNTVPRAACAGRACDSRDNKGMKSSSTFKVGHTSSATKLLGKLRARICRSKTLFVHPEEGADQIATINLSVPSECSSKALKVSSLVSDLRDIKQETFACHLCSFDADRITVLDRHLMNDHKISLENLLTLVMAKTKDGLAEDKTVSSIYGIRQPYYKPPDDMIEEGEFIIETVTPKIKILKHAAVNTDLKGSDIPDTENKYQLIDEEFGKLTDVNSDNDKRDLLAKIETLNECMYKFVDSSNVLKKVLNKEFEQKTSARIENPNNKSIFDLGLGDQESPRHWERPHSDKIERSRSKYGESRSGSEKLKMPSETFYF